MGVVGRPVDGKLQVLAVETAEHGGRAMMDGQIDNIRQVGELARAVTRRLEERLNVQLTQVCVAAAGRALQTERGSFTLEFPGVQTFDTETIGRLETGAVSQAEEKLQSGEADWRQLFLVGYTVTQYRLDNYPLSVLLDHKGRRAEADVVATFLPAEVVESLYAAMKAADLQVISITLEPIAAMNAAIPAELRLLNLALVDIGAGTTDIAVCREGTVVGYTMATIAGDEVTEAIMQAYLVDFAMAESMKRNLCPGEPIPYRDVLGLENSVSYEELVAVTQEPMERLAQAIATQVVEVNGKAPSALFLAGGGSKLTGLRERVVACLEMDDRRVAIAGNNFEKSAFSEEIELKNPEYTTPLGIAISAGLGLLSDNYVITLNGEPAKLFRSGVLTVRDVLLMNGYTYRDMIGRTGRSLSVTLDGRHILVRGEPAAPAVLRVNGEESSINDLVNAGDQILFTPATPGADAARTLDEILGDDAGFGRVLVNNREVPLDTPLRNNDVILTLERGLAEKATEATEAPPEEPEPSAPPAVREEILLYLNDAPLKLSPKEDGRPYYLMDMLQHSGIDFEQAKSPVRLEVNGVEAGFQCVLKSGDRVAIYCT